MAAMRIRAIAYSLILTASTAHAQSAKDPQRQFEADLMKQQVFLKNFSAETEVHARWSPGGVSFDQPYAHMLAAIVVRSVKVSATQVEIAGDRYMLVREERAGWGLGPAAVPVQVLVDIGSTDKDAVFVELLGDLFFTTQHDALAAMPRYLGGSASPDRTIFAALGTANTAPPERRCDCNDNGTELCRGRVAAEGGTPIKLLKAVEPDYTTDAKRNQINGSVSLSFLVDATGQASDVWITRPLGYGMEAKAVQAIQRSKFQPATCHDKPVKAPTNAQINWQRY